MKNKQRENYISIIKSKKKTMKMNKNMQHSTLQHFAQTDVDSWLLKGSLFTDRAGEGMIKIYNAQHYILFNIIINMLINVLHFWLKENKEQHAVSKLMKLFFHFQ